MVWKNKSTRRAVPCFSLKMHEPAGSNHFDTRNSMVLLRLQHPGWTCQTKIFAQRLTLPLSLDKSFGEYFQGQGWHLTRLIGWTSRLVNTRFFRPRHFPSTRNNPSHKPWGAHWNNKERTLLGVILRKKMATQYTTDIPFSSSHHQQAFKLLELPPELLALLESDNPPMYTHPSPADNSS